MIETFHSVMIVPAYNEEKNIGAVISGIKASFPELYIVVVDDGSVDRTADRAREQGADVLSLPCNMGYGVALQTGYKYALQKEFDYCFQMDADGQHEPSSLPQIMDALKENQADVVIGSRFLSQCGYRMPWARKAGKNLFAFIAFLIIHKKMTDPTSGFRGFNKKVLQFLTGEHFPVDYPDVDLLIMIHRAGFKIHEVPVIMYNKESSKSMHSGLKPLYYIFKMLMSIVVILLRK